ncbi:hypothetical protein C8F01DRAFT_1042791 [Mycena amicta]|nr:hypothetical protein C8F01DRAFT_1042791 [Mycena amicta]
MDDSDSDTPPPRRVDGLWFPDGNIVIQAEELIFKVFQGILAARSPIFRDMLAIPPPEARDVDDSFEDCPLVRFPDLQVAADRECFLRAIFDFEFFPAYPAPIEFATLQGCLRLSNKYEVNYLRQRALVHFSSGFPTQLSLLDKRHYEIEEQGDLGVATLLECIEMAREVDALWVLPAAFYALACQLGKTERLVRVVDEASSLLSPIDKSAFLKGYDDHRQAAWGIFAFLADPNVSGKKSLCTQKTKCQASRLRAVGSWLSVLDSRSRKPLHILRIKSGEGPLKHVCEVCRTELAQVFQQKRQVFWDGVPGAYGLPQWGELKRMKKEALQSDDYMEWPTALCRGRFFSLLSSS